MPLLTSWRKIGTLLLASEMLVPIPRNCTVHEPSCIGNYVATQLRGYLPDEDEEEEEKEEEEGEIDCITHLLDVRE